MDILLSPFLIRALLAATVTGLAAPAIGTYLVQRRLSLLGDGIGHICVTGVALGVLTNTAPVATAVVVAVIGALIIEGIRSTGKASGDVALALLFYGGIAGGLVLISLAGNGAFALQGYLFGSITSISTADVWIAVVLAAAVVVLSVALLPQLFAVAHDEAFARTAGLPVGFYNALISVLAAVTVAISMRTVGLLLISALMVVPVATSQQIARGFRTTMAGAMVIGTLAALVGVGTSAFVDVPPGPTIVLVALAAFVLTWPVGALVQRRRRVLVPFVADLSAELPLEHEEVGDDHDHDHDHGPDCGHLAVEHGDHVDYLHDGHRHAVHGAHYDEH